MPAHQNTSTKFKLRRAYTYVPCLLYVLLYGWTHWLIVILCRYIYIYIYYIVVIIWLSFCIVASLLILPRDTRVPLSAFGISSHLTHKRLAKGGNHPRQNNPWKSHHKSQNPIVMFVLHTGWPLFEGPNLYITGPSNIVGVYAHRVSQAMRHEDLKNV